mmetsp:Transcript_38728/g.109800  ORF Transcript_38728/g.109800 Transcript_38728/m.109800 type:complete len:207 (+) Transcript_38728:898-1518(+)
MPCFVSGGLSSVFCVFLPFADASNSLSIPLSYTSSHFCPEATKNARSPVRPSSARRKQTSLTMYMISALMGAALAMPLGAFTTACTLSRSPLRSCVQTSRLIFVSFVGASSCKATSNFCPVVARTVARDPISSRVIIPLETPFRPSSTTSCPTRNSSDAMAWSAFCAERRICSTRTTYSVVMPLERILAVESLFHLGPRPKSMPIT